MDPRAEVPEKANAEKSSELNTALPLTGVEIFILLSVFDFQL
jgi:hypothetical protein